MASKKKGNFITSREYRLLYFTKGVTASDFFRRLLQIFFVDENVQHVL